MSKSDTKAQNGKEPARRNRMIPTFRFPGWQRRTSFVSDLDTIGTIGEIMRASLDETWGSAQRGRLPPVSPKERA